MHTCIVLRGNKEKETEQQWKYKNQAYIVEFVDHLPFHCKFSHALWCEALFSLLGETGLESTYQPYGIWS